MNALSNSNNPCQPQIPQDQTTKNLQFALQQKRRKNLNRMIILPLVFTLVVVALIILARDLTAKNESMSGLQKVGQQLLEFQAKNQRWPSHNEFMKFQLHSRSLSLSGINYDSSYLLDDSPSDTVLAYTGEYQLKLPASGHAVLYLDGQVKWVSAAVLQQQLKKREQIYNGRILHPKNIK